MMEIQRNPLFRLDDIHDLTKDQLRERTMAKLCVQFLRIAAYGRRQGEKRRTAGRDGPGSFARFLGTPWTSSAGADSPPRIYSSTLVSYVTSERIDEFQKVRLPRPSSFLPSYPRTGLISIP